MNTSYLQFLKQSLPKAASILAATFIFLSSSGSTAFSADGSNIVNLEALPRMLRIDLMWEPAAKARNYEVQRSSSAHGPFQTLNNPLPTLFLFTDYIGEPDKVYYYRVRVDEGEWSDTVTATTQPYDRDGFLTEVQEAGFRYFYNFAHPTSHLPREGIKAKDSWTMDTISGVSTGMYFFNMAMGVERGFVTRKDAVQHIAVALKFLTRDTDRFHGAFPHWIHGESGKVIPFSSTDNGADMVETAILAKGLLFAREYFDETNQQEAFIRRTADNLWRTIEWNKFIHNDAMAWHWSPNYGFGNLPIVGFNEAEIAYILGVGSPTYSISPETYWNGWVGKNANYFNPRMVAGENGTIHLQLGHDYGLPMFLMHYSYMGLDPRQVPMPDGNLFEEFERLTLANHDYCTLNAGRFAGYDKFWGLTASLDPDGYKAHEPMHVDNGTISPTGALASMPYQPELVMEMMETMYLQYGEMLWGPFGFYDAFNFSRNWVAYGYIGIDVGPIGPMIENYRTGILWQTFMKAPEVNTAIKEIWTHPNASILAE